MASDQLSPEESFAITFSMRRPWHQVLLLLVGALAGLALGGLLR